MEVENWYWIQDQEDYVIPGLLTELTPRGGLFRLENGKECRKTTQEMQKTEQLDSQCLNADISNLIELHLLTENAILHLLRNRFRQDRIYTFVSSILVAVNPFRDLPIYGLDMIERYRRNPAAQPPHIFITANNVYNALINNYASQSVVISGESGSGKTESIKLILKYVAHISKKSGDSRHHNIQDQILQANPLMEAFGNSKTSRNNNSSRFGKLITLRFSAGGLDEAGIISYLLEKCRVVSHQNGERNFHVFYQLLAAVVDDTDLARSLGMSNHNVDYMYAPRAEVGSVSSINDLDSYLEVQQAMKVMGMSEVEREKIFRIVCAVLLLGNIEFSSTSGGVEGAARLNSISNLEFICDLLGLNSLELHRCLTSRNFGVRSIVTCMFTVAQACDARDAFAKKLYALLFDWLILYINSTLRSKSATKANVFIAVLDIFGFEAFEHNSFEQLLINYCNEKLQYHFNNYIFLMEQSEYEREGVPAGVISYIDNSATLDLIERKNIGILSMIDEEIFIPKGNDDTLLGKIMKTYSSNPCIKRAKAVSGDSSYHQKFVVKHYAGDVPYHIGGFLDKNKDTVAPDLYQIGLSSTDAFVNQIFQNGAEDVGLGATSSSKRSKTAAAASKRTLGTQFKTQLQTLIETLNQTEPHFVRCMKSNMLKVGNNFDSRVMLSQLRYSGLIEVCRIRQNGFPNRITFDKFLRTYWMLCPSATTGSELARALERNGIYNSTQYFVGHSKIFLKFEVGMLLEQARNHQVGACAVRFQRIARGWMSRRRLLHIRKTLVSLKRAIATKARSNLEESLSSAKRYMTNEGRHVPLVREATSLLNRLDEERDAVELLTNALKQMDMDLLENAVKNARAMKPALSSPLVRDCLNAMKDLRAGVVSLPVPSAADRGGASPPPSHTSPPSHTPPPPSEPIGPTLGSMTAQLSRKPPPPPPTAKLLGIVPKTANPSSPPPPPRAFVLAPKTVSSPSPPPPPPPPALSQEERGRPALRNLKRQESRSVTPPPTRHVQFAEPKRAKSPTCALQKVDYTEKFEEPIHIKKPIRTSILTRQLSKDDLEEMSAMHEAIEALVEASSREEGIQEEDIIPLRSLLEQLSESGNQLAQQVTGLVLAKEELMRAQKQLEVQRSLSLVTPTTPQWKVRNLMQQASKLGMDNYAALKSLKAMINSKQKS